MAGSYVTISEAAELEGVKYETMKKKVQRNQERFETRTEKSGSGGKDTVLVAVSSLSKPARDAWKEREKLKSFAEALPEEPAGACGKEKPWYIDVDADWYMENYKENYYKAAEIGNVVRKFLNLSHGDRAEQAEAFARQHLGKGARTLYRYTRAYLEACAWADMLHKEDGAGYEFLKVLCLCRKPKEAGTFPGMAPEVKQCIRNIWFNREFAANLGTREMLYDKLQAVARLNGWEKVPSYPTVTRYIRYLMEDEGMRNAWVLASKGEREYRNRVMVKGSRDTRGLKVMQIVMGDEHTFDCWVSYKLPNGKLIAIRPKLVAWIDMRSRQVLGDVMCRDGNSDILKHSLLKLIYHDAGSVPQYIYIDNGKDYTSQTMTGYQRRDRRRAKQEDKMAGYFDDMTRGFYRSIGIEDDLEALPYQPWSKGNIERFFGQVCSSFTKWFSSYTGTLTGSSTDAKVDKDIQKMLEAGQLLTMEEFYQEWSRWLHEVYMKKSHSGLKRAGEEWTTPEEVFRNADRYFKAAPPKSYATVLMMRSDSVRVYNTGISRFGYQYRSEELCTYIGRTVNIKYDPEDMATLYVFDGKGRKLCEAYAQELLQITDTVSERTLDHIRMQKRQESRDRKRLEEANIPFEQLNDQYVGFSSVTGGIDLMIRNKKQKPAKVVSLPEDRTYQQGFRGGKKEDAVQESGYMSAQAENALKKLRAMGG